MSIQTGKKHLWKQKLHLSGPWRSFMTFPIPAGHRGVRFQALQISGFLGLTDYQSLNYTHTMRHQGRGLLAVFCILFQSAVPALACPCPRPGKTTAKAACSRTAAAPCSARLVKTVQPTPAKKCCKCSRAKTCASKKQTRSSSPNCNACPYRQAKDAPTPAPLPPESSRQDSPCVQAGFIAVTDAALEMSCRPSPDDKPLDLSSHNDRQSQMMCWLK